MAKRRTWLSEASYMNQDDYFRDLHRGIEVAARTVEILILSASARGILTRPIKGGGLKSWAMKLAKRYPDCHPPTARKLQAAPLDRAKPSESFAGIAEVHF